MPAHLDAAHRAYLADYGEADKDYYAFFARHGVDEEDAYDVFERYEAAMDKCSMGALMEKAMGE